MQLRNLHNAALVLLAACAVPSFAAGWSVDVWPVESYPRAIDRQIAECWTGATERATAQNVTAPAALAWWRSNRGNVISIKDSMKGMINGGTVKWVRTNVVDTTSNAALCLSTNANNWITWTNHKAFLAAHKFPTNYFEYTPYRSINGVGPFTNDATVAYPHGWTNASTAAGGTNYPGARTKWYTTDYGVARLPELLNALVVTTVPTVSASNVYWRGVANDRSTWADAKNVAVTNYHQISGFGIIGTRGDGLWFPPSTPSPGYHYYCIIDNMSSQFKGGEYYGTLTNRIEYYAYAEHIPSSIPPIDVDNRVFDSVDYPTLAGGTNAFSFLTYEDGTNGWSAAIGSTNLPTWCADPGVDPSYGDGLGVYVFTSSLGAKISTHRAIRRWNTSGGFTFY